jgi:hypothetical protein
MFEILAAIGLYVSFGSARHALGLEPTKPIPEYYFVSAVLMLIVIVPLLILYSWLTS